MASTSPGEKFERPASVILLGPNRPLLNWTAFALASRADAAFVWTDVRLRGEEPDPSDPLGRGAVPADRLSIVRPDELVRTEASAARAESARASLISPEEPGDSLRRVSEFLRLPTHTQELIARRTRRGHLSAFVLSNAHRLVALYPTGAVGPAVRAIVDSGVLLIATFADAPPEGRLSFDIVLHVAGAEPDRWRDAVMRVEQAPAGVPFVARTTARLADEPTVAPVLAETLG